MITVVTGPPCSGKTTYVREHRTWDDVVLDFDVLAHALGHRHTQTVIEPDHPSVDLARWGYTAILRTLLAKPPSYDVWIVNARPAGWMRANLRDAGARFIALDPGEDVCAERAFRYSSERLRAVRDWYSPANTPARDW